MKQFEAVGSLEQIKFMDLVYGSKVKAKNLNKHICNGPYQKEVYMVEP